MARISDDALFGLGVEYGRGEGLASPVEVRKNARLSLIEGGKSLPHPLGRVGVDADLPQTFLDPCHKNPLLTRV
jgi:hypothetical protein